MHPSRGPIKVPLKQSLKQQKATHWRGVFRQNSHEQADLHKITIRKARDSHLLTGSQMGTQPPPEYCHPVLQQDQTIRHPLGNVAPLSLPAHPPCCGGNREPG